MASTTPKTIVLSDEVWIRDERQANNVAITPGQLIEPTGAKVQLHSVESGDAARWWAVENPWAGGTVAAVDKAYGTADNVFFVKAQRGQRLYAWLAPGQNVAANANLESAGSLGALQALTAGTALASSRLLAKAVEAVNNAAGTVNARIKIEVI